MMVEMVLKDIGVGYLYEKTIDRYALIEKIEITEKLPSSEISYLFITLLVYHLANWSFASPQKLASYS